MYFCLMKESQKIYNQRHIYVDDYRMNFYAVSNDVHDIDYIKKALQLIIREKINLFSQKVYIVDKKGDKKNILDSIDSN